MEKFQLYRTALDAIHFLLTSDIGLSNEELDCLDGIYFSVIDQAKDEIHNIVSLKAAKEVK